MKLTWLNTWAPFEEKKHVLVYFQSFNFLVFEMQKGISFPQLSSIMVLKRRTVVKPWGPCLLLFNDVKKLSEEKQNNAHLTVFVCNSYRRSCMKFGGLWKVVPLYHPKVVMLWFSPFSIRHLRCRVFTWNQRKKH